jgi:hypothetical protein
LAAGQSRIIGGVHVPADNTGGLGLGAKVGALVFDTAQSTCSFGGKFRAADTQNEADVVTHATAFLDPKAASAAQLLAACQSITATCGEKELQAYLEAGDAAPLQNADELRASLGVDESYKITGDMPPCMACRSVPSEIGSVHTLVANNVEG